MPGWVIPSHSGPCLASHETSHGQPWRATTWDGNGFCAVLRRNWSGIAFCALLRRDCSGPSKWDGIGFCALMRRDCSVRCCDGIVPFLTRGTDLGSVRCHDTNVLCAAATRVFHSRWPWRSEQQRFVKTLSVFGWGELWNRWSPLPGRPEVVKT